MQSLLTRYSKGDCIWDHELSYVISVLTARMDQFIPNINQKRQAIFNQIIALPVMDRTLQKCCDITLENL